MNTIELHTQRIELARQILKEEDENVLKKTMAYFKRIKKTALAPPCQMTIEELKEEISQAVCDLENGSGIPHEEIEKKVSSW